MNAVQNFASHSFSTYALKNIRIDEDANGLFCQVPSSDGCWYTVRCVESKTNVYASHCNCSSFARHQHCTHIEVTQKYWRRFYKPVVVAVVEAPVKAEAPVKKTRKPRTGLVRKVRGGGLVKVEQPVVKPAVAEAEQTVAPKLTNPFKRPSRWLTEQLEKEQNYREIKSQMRELKERREYAPLNGNRAFSIMR